VGNLDWDCGGWAVFLADVLRRCLMNPLEIAIAHLRKITPDFYGQIVIRFKEGKPVHISEEKSIKIEEEQGSCKRNSEVKAG
jgi:hypothetical protein